MRDLKLKSIVGDKRVSTVRLANELGAMIDRLLGSNPDDKPYETMVFPLDSFGDLYMERYDTAEDAEAGHERICGALAEGTLPLSDPYESYHASTRMGRE